jgi:aspartate aminotransferase
MRSEFQRRRDYFVNALNTIRGVSCRMPKGAFYAFPNITGTGFDERELADRLLEEAGIACLPGSAFGVYGAGHLRFSMANSMENLELAIERLKRFLEKQ